MKITLQTISAGPMGVARAGTVLDVSPEQAEQLIKERCARPYDRERDEQAPHGYTQAKE